MIAPSTRRSIVFVNRFFYPDQSATSLILSDLAFALAENGESVRVVTSARGRPGLAPELINSVRVYRTRAGDLSSFGLVGRACEYAKFYFGATQLLRRIVRRGDILVAKTDPPLIAVVAAVVANRRGAILINWLQDLYPEVAAGLHVPLIRGPIFSLLRRLRDYALRSARINLAIGGQMAEVLRGRGIDDDGIAIMPNWLDDRTIYPVAREDNELLNRMNLQGKFVIGYCGNLGRAHEYGTLLGAARLLAYEEDLIFMFIATGHQVKLLMEKVAAEGLADRFRFLPPQPISDLKFALSAPNVHWISLRPEMEGLIVPSKFYGALAAGRPTLAVMSKTDELAALVEKHGCGIAIASGDSEGLARHISRLKSNPRLCEDMGQRARDLFDQNFTRKKAIVRWVELIRSVGAC
jgi:glycosyltransferase involved in cell wall biosynthesis